MDKRKKRAGAEYGANALEYALIAALVAVVIIGGLSALGSSLENKLSTASTVQPAAPGSSGDETTDSPGASATTALTPEAHDETSTGVPAVENATPTPGEEGPRILADTLCWLGPGSAYEVVSVVRAGSPVEVLGVGLGGDWLVVDNPHFPGVVCWVSFEAIELPESAVLPDTVFPIPPTPTLTPEPEKREGCIVNNKCEVPCPVPGQYPVCYQ
jgi:pilus assembly protein Flp/PilA